MSIVNPANRSSKSFVNELTSNMKKANSINKNDAAAINNKKRKGPELAKEEQDEKCIDVFVYFPQRGLANIRDSLAVYISKVPSEISNENWTLINNTSPLCMLSDKSIENILSERGGVSIPSSSTI